jgi:hypothetical protein
LGEAEAVAAPLARVRFKSILIRVARRFFDPGKDRAGLGGST